MLTEASAGKRIRQVLSIQDSYSLLLEEEGTVIEFAMGYFKQYDDIVGYTFEEILITYEYKKKGIGSFLLKELEPACERAGYFLCGTSCSE